MTKLKKSRKKVAVFTVMMLGMVMTAGTLTGCGSSTDAEASGGTMGRITSISDTSLEIEVMKNRGGDSQESDFKGAPPDAASGSAVGPNGEKPDGNPPQRPGSDSSDGNSANPNDGNGTPPQKPDSDSQNGNSNTAPGNGGGPGGFSGERESKTYTLNDSTKYYRDEDDSSTSISASDVQPGDMVKVVADGEAATEVHIVSISGMGGMRGPSSNGGDGSDNGNNGNDSGRSRNGRGSQSNQGNQNNNNVTAA